MRRGPIRLRAVRNLVLRNAGQLPFGPVMRDFRDHGDRPSPAVVGVGLGRHPAMVGKLSGLGAPASSYISYDSSIICRAPPYFDEAVRGAWERGWETPAASPDSLDQVQIAHRAKVRIAVALSVRRGDDAAEVDDSRRLRGPELRERAPRAGC